MDERRIAKAAREFEHLIIDTQAQPALDELKDLVAGCDLLVIPSTPDALALDALMQTVDALEELGSDRYKILLTIIPPAPSRDGDIDALCGQDWDYLIPAGENEMSRRLFVIDLASLFKVLASHNKSVALESADGIAAFPAMSWYPS